MKRTAKWALSVLLLSSASLASVEVARQHTIVRKPLLTALLDGEKPVGRVEVKEIEFVAHQATGLHLHPCPVVGYIAKGSIVFQVEGEAQKTLHAGDAFYEPANRKILKFDSEGAPATFVAYYLLGASEHDLIRML